MKLTKPIYPFIITQAFGVNGEYYQSNGINIKGHNGFDLKASHGQEVYASHDGWAYYEVDDKGGHGVVILGDGIKTIYWHLCDPIKEPQYTSPITKPRNVKAGEVIGYADSTGFSTGDHLHFGIKEINAKGETININNGYSGAIDPTPYFYEYKFVDEIGYGDTNNEVKELQKRLGVKQTGFFGFLTLTALFKYQLKHDLKPFNGRLHEKVRTRLNQSDR
jgi:hypothetical protein